MWPHTSTNDKKYKNIQHIPLNTKKFNINTYVNNYTMTSMSLLNKQPIQRQKDFMLYLASKILLTIETYFPYHEDKSHIEKLINQEQNIKTHNTYKNFNT